MSLWCRRSLMGLAVVGHRIVWNEKAMQCRNSPFDRAVAGSQKDWLGAKMHWCIQFQRARAEEKHL
jgi:hypothetical protein